MRRSQRDGTGSASTGSMHSVPTTTRHAGAHARRYGNAKLDRWEADFVRGGDTMKKDSKRELTRALRRSEAAHIEDNLNGDDDALYYRDDYGCTCQDCAPMRYFRDGRTRTRLLTDAQRDAAARQRLHRELHAAGVEPAPARFNRIRVGRA